jgi:signal transduction histidine kinase
VVQYDANAIPGLRWSELTTGVHREIDRKKLGELFERGHCQPWRTEFLAKDGNRIPVLIGMVRSPDKSDQGVALVLDISNLQQAEDDSRRLAGRLLNLYDDERKSIARELHDKAAQNLAALSMNLAMLGSALDDKSRAVAILKECTDLAEETLKEVRSLSYMLHPPLLDELGLESALRSFIDLFQRRTDVKVELVLNQAGRVAPHIELAAFRIAQEGLFNVQRHSASKRAELRVSRLESSLEVIVRDWGKGIEGDEAIGNSLGIAGMRERARLLGGQLEIVRADPGTMVRAVFPVER